jgi:hypothetical protein
VNVAEVILVFVGAPLAIFLLLAALTYLPGGRRRPRYRPGQPWDHAPVWYEPHPLATGDHGATHAALESEASVGPRGGARGTW